jgi:hypothetical protein
MRHLIFTSIALCSTFLIIGCTNQPKRPDECKAYLKTVKEDWTYLEEKRIYKVVAQDGRKNMDFVTKLLYEGKPCWIGLPAKKVRKLFGEPSKIEGTRWRYFIQESCWDEKKLNCQDFLIGVDPEKGLVSIELGAYSVVE